MQNFTTWNHNDPLTIKMTGTGEYIKKQCANLVQMFEDTNVDHLEEIRQEQENG
jgi:hypothetical protein